MRQKVMAVLLLGCVLFCGFLQDAACAGESRERAFSQRYLTVPPPEGWKRETKASGMFSDCIFYAPQDESLALMACPGFERDRPFAEVMADVKTGEDAMRFGRCVIYSNEEGVMLHVPLKKGKEGAFFVIIEDNPAPGLIQKAWPMLRAFTDFDIPEKPPVPQK
ncbi:hypothetical protein [Oxalobacter paraformigenes]|uniref:Uncharacterized protein n=1 Tax=Oxalobacter paraformigenes TaxID=556268 RepID=C3X4N7_9BURK|nr:hypothetical protein [Oxalobacter paraformigenes]EEO28173.2 hypothetical protein OFAG_01326 [Oxalobacter paraformigenes]